MIFLEVSAVISVILSFVFMVLYIVQAHRGKFMPSGKASALWASVTMVGLLKIDTENTVAVATQSAFFLLTWYLTCLATDLNIRAGLKILGVSSLSDVENLKVDKPPRRVPQWPFPLGVVSIIVYLLAADGSILEAISLQMALMGSILLVIFKAMHGRGDESLRLWGIALLAGVFSYLPQADGVLAVGLYPPMSLLLVVVLMVSVRESRRYGKFRAALQLKESEPNEDSNEEPTDTHKDVK